MSAILTDNDRGGTHLSLDVVFFTPIIAIILMIIALIVKLLGNCDGEEDRRANETSGLLVYKDEEVLFSSYGTTTRNEEDIETGIGSCSSSCDDLYDGKVCVICYDDERSCFFIPCGHCITCHTCANRIFSEEIKTCPICRTFINKVMKLQIL